MTPYCKVLPKMFVLLYGSFSFSVHNYSKTKRVLWPEHVSEAERRDTPLNIPFVGVRSAQSLTLTVKPNPAQITLWHNISLVGLIVCFFPVYNEIRTSYVSGWRSACTFQINFINLNVMYVLFLKPLGKPPKKLNNWKSRVYMIFIRHTLFPWKHSFSYCATEHSKHAHKMK